MYIKKYWGNFIGGTDDALTLIDYIESKNKSVLNLSEIIRELKLDKLFGTDKVKTNSHFIYFEFNGFTAHFIFSIDLIINLSTILLEVLKNGRLNIQDLGAEKLLIFSILAEKQEIKQLASELNAFSETPFLYQLSNMMPENDVIFLANECQEIYQELLFYI